MDSVATSRYFSGFHRTLPTRSMVETLRSRRARGGFLTPAAALNAIAAGYWAVFWIMNGLDKFLNRSDLGAIFWYGKDRTEQFGDYYARLNLSSEAIAPTLYLAGVWELIAAVPMALAVIALLTSPDTRLAKTLLYWGFVLTGLTLIGFSAFDVVAGDRAELREHGLYLALMFACCLWTRNNDAELVH